MAVGLSKEEANRIKNETLDYCKRRLQTNAQSCLLVNGLEFSVTVCIIIVPLQDSFMSANTNSKLLINKKICALVKLGTQHTLRF